MTKIYDDSRNYTCQIIQIFRVETVPGLDNLVKASYQGNDCLIGKDYTIGNLYMFFPAECEISHEFLSANNLYRTSSLNSDPNKKGFFEDNRRCKAIKFKGVISSGFICPLDYLHNLESKNGKFRNYQLKEGSEFNEIEGVTICKKYLKPLRNNQGSKKDKLVKLLDKIVDSRFAPEHPDVSHLLKNCLKLKLEDYIAVTHKLHGTSARYFNTLVKRKLSLRDKIAKFFGVKVLEETYDYVTGSRRVIKSVGFEELSGKNHWFTKDLWTEVGKELLEGKLYKGESVYLEIIGRTYSGEEIQPDYSYGLRKPEVYIYRISNINPQGIEVDLSYLQMKERANQLGIKVCPEYFYGKFSDLIPLRDDRDKEPMLEALFYGKLLEKPSILDSSVIEEGFVISVDKYPRREMYKIKAKSFLLKESALNDKPEIRNIEDEESAT